MNTGMKRSSRGLAVLSVPPYWSPRAQGLPFLFPKK